MQNSQESKTLTLTQDYFPGSYIEPKWSRIDLIQKSPYYAIRFLLSDKITYLPRGREDFVSMLLDGMEYIIETSNFIAAKKLAQVLENSFFKAKGFNGITREVLRSNPDTMLSAHLFASEYALRDQDIPLDKTRMFWLRPDVYASGHYRSFLPAQYQEKLPDFYTENRDGLSHIGGQWFDAFAVHRVPTPEQLNLFQNLHHANKVMMYEYDDDIFNIPEWNPTSPLFDKSRLARAKAAMEIADIIVGSTERLCEISPRPDISFHGPNLVDCSNIEVLDCNTELDNGLIGYYPVRRNKKVVYESKHGPTVEGFLNDMSPVRIIWAGSNTHDKDLKQIIDPVIMLGKKYGMAIHFIFFGYCPLEFLKARVEVGNTNAEFVIKDEYSHFISYFEMVSYNSYYKSIESLNPDISLCPVVPDPFNLAKSNLKVLEFGAMGVPSIASDYGPYKFIEHGVDGLKVKCEDKSAWGRAIESLIVDRELRQKLGSNIRDRVFNDYSWNCDSLNRRKWDIIFGEIHNHVLSRRPVDIYDESLGV